MVTLDRGYKSPLLYPKWKANLQLKCYWKWFELLEKCYCYHDYKENPVPDTCIYKLFTISSYTNMNAQTTKAHFQKNTWMTFYENKTYECNTKKTHAEFENNLQEFKITKYIWDIFHLPLYQVSSRSVPRAFNYFISVHFRRQDQHPTISLSVCMFEDDCQRLYL